MNKGLFGFTAKVDSKGYVTLEAKAVTGKAKANAKQQAMHDYLNKIITDPADITVDVESGTKTLVGSYATGKIDMKDIEAMSGGTGGTDTGSLIHELVEQYHKQVNKTGYGGETTGAHHEGIAAENAVNGSARGSQKVVSATQHPDGTIDAVVEIPYTFPDGKVVTTTLTIVSNNIAKSEDKVTTPGKTK
jgi:protein subunit release factor A